jgi:hypothetical protein
MNEPPSRSDSKLCPICSAKIPFSLAMHMVAAHSPNAIENTATTPELAFRDAQALAHQHWEPKPVSDSRGPNQTRGGSSKFARKNGRRRH